MCPKERFVCRCLCLWVHLNFITFFFCRSHHTHCLYYSSKPVLWMVLTRPRVKCKLWKWLVFTNLKEKVCECRGRRTALEGEGWVECIRTNPHKQMFYKWFGLDRNNLKLLQIFNPIQTNKLAFFFVYMICYILVHIHIWWMISVGAHNTWSSNLAMHEKFTRNKQQHVILLIKNGAKTNNTEWVDCVEASVRLCCAGT